MSDLEELLAAGERLRVVLDEVIEGAEPDLQVIPDWAYYRFGTALVLVRDEGDVSIAAGLARGLLEEAAYWDWAIATGASLRWQAARAAAEYARLVQLADELDDRVWTEWLLPPFSGITSASFQGLPSNAEDLINRLGHGFSSSVADPLQLGGLRAAYQLLEVLAHGGILAAMMACPGAGRRLPTALTAATVHLAAASAAAIVVASLDLQEPQLSDVVAATEELTLLAGPLHGLPGGQPRRTQRPSRARGGIDLEAVSVATRMPDIPPALPAAAQAFCDSADALMEVVGPHLQYDTSVQSLASCTVLLGYAHLSGVSAALQGTFGLALTPFCARPLLEEGGRWLWMLRRASESLEETEAALHGYVGDAQTRLRRIQETFRSSGIPEHVVEEILGTAQQILNARTRDYDFPAQSVTLREGYAAWGGEDWVRPIYSVLSQWTHATPLAALHLRRGQFTSLTTPMLAVALDAACHGFLALAIAAVPAALTPKVRQDVNTDELTARCSEVRFVAGAFHLIG